MADEPGGRRLTVALGFARLSMALGIIAGLTGAARAVTTGSAAGGAALWLALGVVPLAGAWTSWKLLRGPGGEGLLTVAVVTILLGAGVVAIWVLYVLR